MIAIELEAEEYDLQKSFEPSFVSSLYENPKPGVWIKVAGTLGKALRLEQHGDWVAAFCSTSIDEEHLKSLIVLETGLWYRDPSGFLEKVRAPFRGVLEKLAETHRGVRIPIAPHDAHYILLSVLLSRRANYEMVRRWCYAIWSRYDGNLERLAYLKPGALKAITRSYQLLEAVSVLRRIVRRFGSLRDWARDAASKPPELARLALLSVKGIGPKLADSVILSISRAPHFAPCDAHLARLVRRLGLIPGFRLPVKSLCARYACVEDLAERYGLKPCPIRGSCLRGILTSRLGPLAGWFQTLAYLHGRSFCRASKPDCDRCPLRRLCASSGKYN